MSALGLALVDRRRSCRTRRRRAGTTAPLGPGTAASLLAESGEQCIAGGMSEGVVVALEAVEVEEHEERLVAIGSTPSRRSRSAMSLRRLPSPVSASVVASWRVSSKSRLFSRNVTTRRDDDEQQRRRRERDGEDVDPVRKWSYDEDRRSRRARRRPGRRAAAGPRRRAPPACDPASTRRAAMRSIAAGQSTSTHVPSTYVPFADWKRKTASAGSRGEDPEAEEQPATARLPAREREDAEDGGEEQDVAQRVGEVRDDDRRRALRRLENELDEHGCSDGGGGQRCRQAVQPERSRDRAGARAEKEDDPDVEEHVEGDEARVGHDGERLGLEDHAARARRTSST